MKRYANLSVGVGVKKKDYEAKIEVNK